MDGLESSGYLQSSNFKGPNLTLNALEKQCKIDFEFMRSIGGV